MVPTNKDTPPIPPSACPGLTPYYLQTFMSSGRVSAKLSRSVSAFSTCSIKTL